MYTNNIKEKRQIKLITKEAFDILFSKKSYKEMMEEKNLKQNEDKNSDLDKLTKSL